MKLPPRLSIDPLRALVNFTDDIREGGPRHEWFQYDSSPTDVFGVLSEVTEYRGGIAIGPHVDPPALVPLGHDEADAIRGLVSDPDLCDVDAFHEAQQGGHLSAGSEALLAILRRLLEIQQQDYEFLTLVLDMQTMTRDAHLLIRDAFHGVRETLEANGTSTFVLEGAEFDMGGHVGLFRDGRHSRATRRSVDGGSLPVSRAEEDRRFISGLARNWDTRPLVFLLGAGVSASSGLPLGNRARDHLLSEMYDEVPSSERPAHFVRLFQAGEIDKLAEDPVNGMAETSANERLTLERVWRAAEDADVPTGPTLHWFDTKNSEGLRDPGEAIQLCRQLVHAARTRRQSLVLMTVNFDTLLEPAFDGHDDEILVCGKDDGDVIAEQVSLRLDGQIGPLMVKMHGTLNDKSSLITSLAQTASTTHLGWLDVVTARMRNNDLPIIHVGHSLRDEDLVKKFIAVTDAGSVGRRWVGPHVPDDGQFRFVRLLESGGAGLDQAFDRVVRESTNATADHFFRLLVSYL